MSSLMRMVRPFTSKKGQEEVSLVSYHKTYNSQGLANLESVKLRLFARLFQFLYGLDSDRVACPIFFVSCVCMVWYVQVKTLVSLGARYHPVGHYAMSALIFGFFKSNLDRFRSMFFVSLDCLSFVRTILPLWDPQHGS